MDTTFELMTDASLRSGLWRAVLSSGHAAAGAFSAGRPREGIIAAVLLFAILISVTAKVVAEFADTAFGPKAARTVRAVFEKGGGRVILAAVGAWWILGLLHVG